MRDQEISDLLALRDGELPEAAAAEVLARPGAAVDLDRIRRIHSALNALPDPVVDPMVGPVMNDALWAKSRAKAQPRPVRGGAIVRFPGRFLPHAAAAGLLLALGAGLLATHATRQDVRVDEAIALPAAANAGREDPVLQGLHERSRRLEPLLVSADRRDPTEQALRLRIADLDGEIAGIPDRDDGQADRQMEQQLWGRRVALLESLAEVRRARATLQPAVY